MEGKGRGMSWTELHTSKFVFIKQVAGIEVELELEFEFELNREKVELSWVV